MRLGNFIVSALLFPVLMNVFSLDALPMLAAQSFVDKSLVTKLFDSGIITVEPADGEPLSEDNSEFHEDSFEQDGHFLIPKPVHISPVLPYIRHPLQQLPPLEYETPQQRSSRINILTYTLTMKSVGQHLFWLQPPFAPSKWRPALNVARLFISNPFSIPAGYVAIDQSAYPFNYAKVPGMAPFEYLCSPDRIPQCIRAEYDPGTGTYIQIMVPWGEYQSNVHSVNLRQTYP